MACGAKAADGANGAQAAANQNANFTRRNAADVEAFTAGLPGSSGLAGTPGLTGLPGQLGPFSNFTRSGGAVQPGLEQYIRSQMAQLGLS